MINPYKLLKLNRLIKGHRLKCVATLLADIAAIRHLSIRMDPVLGCNLGCHMCKFSSPEFRKNNTGVLSVADYERIASLLFKKAILVVIGTGAEPTLHREYPRLVKIAKGYNVPYIGFSTNGQRLTETSVHELYANGLDELMISMHGVKKETYERLMPPASHDQLHNVLGVCSKEKAKHDRRILLRVNFTVNPDNVLELADFFQAYGGYAIDILQIRPIMDLGAMVYTKKDFSPFKDQFDSICASLRRECHARGMTLLAPPPGPQTGGNNAAGILKPLVNRYVSPAVVWETGFDWRNQTYEQYCRKIKWRSQLISMACKKLEDIDFSNRSLSYDVDV